MFGELGNITQMISKYKKLQEALQNTIIRAKQD
jgi:hypothetical protein